MKDAEYRFDNVSAVLIGTTREPINSTKKCFARTATHYIIIKRCVLDGAGNTTPGNRSWGCSRDDDTVNVQTLRVIGTTAKFWTTRTWHLVGSLWKLVSSESGEGEIAPEPLQRCLPDDSNNSGAE